MGAEVTFQSVKARPACFIPIANERVSYCLLGYANIDSCLEGEGRGSGVAGQCKK